MVIRAKSGASSNNYYCSVSKEDIRNMVTDL